MEDIQNILQNPSKIVLAVIIVDMIGLVLARNNIVGKVINEWYDKFTIGAFIGDVSSISFGIFLSLLIWKYILPSKYFNFWWFLLTVVVIQVVHDACFGYIIKIYPDKQNNMMDVFKSYVNENGFKILGVDAVMMISSVLLIYGFTYYFDSSVIYTLLALALYVAMFLIY